MSITFVKLSLSLYGIITVLIQEATSRAAQDLGPILEPDPIQFSFDTPGWYFIGILLFLVCFFVAFRFVKNYKENAYRREAIQKLNKVNLFISPNDLEQQLSTILTILRIVAFQTYGRKEVASLYGKSWLLFLESKAKNTRFTKFEPIISRTIYENERPDSKALNELMNLSKKWIQTHA